MSRTIKFRVWAEKKFYTTGKAGIFPAGLSDSFGLFFSLRPNKRAESEGMVVEQFTGLTDKNGKEIYEGDIVKASLADRWGNLESEDAKQVGRINYRADTAGFSICPTLLDGPFRVDISVLFLRSSVSERLEVIGNIHENPELLSHETQGT